MANLFAQAAQGEFSFDVIPNTPHCGPTVTGMQHAEYRISIQYDRKPLDSNGFLLDNTAFSEYFAKLTGPVSISCEQLCVQICHDLFERRMKSITVGLSAVTGVWVTSTYQPTIAEKIIMQHYAGSINHHGIRLHKVLYRTMRRKYGHVLYHVPVVGIFCAGMIWLIGEVVGA